MVERFANWQKPKIEHGKLTEWNWVVQNPDNFKLGKDVDIGSFTYINAKYGVEIEEGVQIGSHCSIYSISTIDNKQGKIILKRNSKVGAHSTIMPGVVIGENSVIGAHSFVNKCIPDNVIAFGIPVRVVETIKNEKNLNLWKIPLFKTYSDEQDVEAVTEVIKRGAFWTTGPEIEEFEKKIAEFIGTKYALSFNSGTSALLALLLACDLKNSEVIIPSFTFIATANAVVLAGAKPVFAESEPETFGLDIGDVRRKMTPQTKAIIPLHYGGCASRDIYKLKEICERNNLLLLDDAAESLGTTINGEKIGVFSDASVFSLCQNKVISSGEGGIVTTNNQEIYEKMKLLRSHGRSENGKVNYFSSTEDSDYLELGYNFRISSISAALALAQLKKIDLIIKLRKKNALLFNQELSRINLVLCPIAPSGFDHFYQMYTLILPDELTRERLKEFLMNKGIQTKVYFNPVHLKSFYKRRYGYKEGDLPRTEQLSKKVLTLPMSATLSESDAYYILASIKEFFNSGRGEGNGPLG